MNKRHYFSFLPPWGVWSFLGWTCTLPGPQVLPSCYSKSPGLTRFSQTAFFRDMSLLHSSAFCAPRPLYFASMAVACLAVYTGKGNDDLKTLEGRVDVPVVRQRKEPTITPIFYLPRSALLLPFYKRNQGSQRGCITSELC